MGCSSRWVPRGPPERFATCRPRQPGKWTQRERGLGGDRTIQHHRGRLRHPHRGGRAGDDHADGGIARRGGRRAARSEHSSEEPSDGADGRAAWLGPAHGEGSIRRRRTARATHGGRFDFRAACHADAAQDRHRRGQRDTSHRHESDSFAGREGYRRSAIHRRGLFGSPRSTPSGYGASPAARHGFSPRIRDSASAPRG